MNFQQAVQSCFAKYATFAGRASRSEFWYWILFSTLASTAAGILDRAFDLFVGYDAGVIAGLWGLGTLLPLLAVSVRRLHDIGRIGWWLVLFFVPFFGGLLLIVWFCIKGSHGYNGFGPDPLPRESNDTRHRVKTASI